MNSDPETIGFKPANKDKVQYVSWKDLPLSCPMPDTSLWDSHQRVYLPIHETGHERCPYCGTEYVLLDEHADKEHIAQPNIEIEDLQSSHTECSRLGRR